MCGKGGVGKTSLSATIVKILSSNPNNKVLAIDADPAVGLSTALGIEVSKTVDDIRNELIKRVGDGKATDKAEMLSMLDYEMFSALEEHKNIAFLAIGRPEKEGCYCQVNHILKDLIASMADNFDYVVIDGEAGIEQVNRRVMEKVTHLILVSDASRKGLNVVQTIKDVSDDAIDYEKAGLILNRLRNAEEREKLSIPPELNCLGWIPEDDTIRSFDIEGKSILEIDDSPAMAAVKNCLREIGL
ncbi:MAG: cobyrinic acid a,c-diamide synthase [Desulfobacteraceae bacterium]|nr:MAG: cobyrinic acid a,c-diamide synthase [Desulfobacteraceae bacterium]